LRVLAAIFSGSLKNPYLVSPNHDLMKKCLPFLLLSFFFGSSGLLAQDWVRKMQDPNLNFYEVQKSFNSYWEKTERRNALRRFVGAKEIQGADENYEMYKRWEYFTEPRVYPSGDRSLISKASDEIWNYKSKRPNAMQMAANWTLLGPTSSIPGRGGAGRINCVAIDPVNPQTIYVGAPVGGLWKSTNGGTSWSSTTDHLPVIGVSDILIDPTNTNVIYISSGDADHSDSYSCGILKSMDGGLTWNQTGLSFSTSGSRMVYCLLMNPADHTMLFAGTSTGLYKSTDSGVTWTKMLNATIRDMEFKPTDPTTMYAVSNTGFYRSQNTGKSFLQVSTGLPAGSNLCRLSLATTAADPNYLYVLASTANGYYYQGLYLSTNAGTSFTSMSNSPNLLGFYSGTGTDAATGQGWYTLSVAVSPINKMEVIVGGVNIWRSTNAGASWNKISDWTSQSSVHADIHELRYVPGTGTFYAASDGGCFRTTNGGASWANLSNGLQIAQMYRIGCAQTDPNIIIQGWQDNGTNEYNTGSWSQIWGGDGMDCFIDYTNANTMYATNPNGSLRLSLNGGGSWQRINSNITGTGSLVTPWGLDPVTPTTIYAGFQELWKSTDQGASWTAISTFGLPTSAPITSFAVAKSDPQCIYVSNGNQFYATINGGSNWTNLSPTMPGSNLVTAIEVAASNPYEVWITYSGYSPSNKVFRSLDGGHVWTNIASSTLPNMPVNCIVTQPGSADGAYIGTDVGVYYKDSSMTDWAPFMNGLPNVNISHLQIHAASKKLRAGTFGRGLWETNLFDPASTVPLANFTANITTGCPGTTVLFTDLSTNGASSWNWTFQGGTPPTSNLQNPTVSFSNPGSYNYVKLVVSNASAQSDSITRFSYIAISPQIQPTITLIGKDTVCSGQSIILTSSLGNSYSWFPNGSSLPNITPSSTGSYTVSVTDVFGCTSVSAPMHVVINPIPLPNITQSGDTLFSSFSSGNQWYRGGVLIPGATGPFYVINGSGFYTVHVTSAEGCTGISNSIVGIREDAALQSSMNVFPNPNDGRFMLEITLSGHAGYTLRISDVMGRVVYSEQFASNGSQQKSFDLSTFGKGVYLLEVSGSKGKAVKKVIVY
jgi:PKD repeat protein